MGILKSIKKTYNKIDKALGGNLPNGVPSNSLKSSSPSNSSSNKTSSSSSNSTKSSSSSVSSNSKSSGRGTYNKTTQTYTDEQGQKQSMNLANAQKLGATITENAQILKKGGVKVGNVTYHGNSIIPNTNGKTANQLQTELRKQYAKETGKNIGAGRISGSFEILSPENKKAIVQKAQSLNTTLPTNKNATINKNFWENSVSNDNRSDNSIPIQNSFLGKIKERYGTKNKDDWYDWLRFTPYPDKKEDREYKEKIKGEVEKEVKTRKDLNSYGYCRDGSSLSLFAPSDKECCRG
jgi:hypothetical protein